MNQVEILGKVTEIVSKQLSVNHTEVTPDASFIEKLGADSLDTVEMIMTIEEVFGIEVPEREAHEMKTVQDVVDYVLRSRSQN